MLRLSSALAGATIATLATAAPLCAQSAAPPCVDARTQAAMTECATTEAAAIERRLAALLAELRPRLDSARAARLAIVQRRWSAYREAHCAWEAAAFAGGSIQPMWEANCHATLTLQRIEVLRFQLCEGTGMTGSCPAAE